MGARSAIQSARRSPTPIRRGNPETAKASNGKPASGTRRASILPGVPAKVTSAPRACSASAIARAGTTCPAVPPAAIRHRTPLALRSTMHGDVKENAHAREREQQVGAAVGDERKRNSGQRRDAEDGREVDDGLAADERREAGREPLAEGILRVQRDAEPRVREGREREHDEGDADEAELLADDREDHVRVGLREVLDLLDPLPQAASEPAPGAEADQRLARLVAGALDVLERVQEREEPRALVGVRPEHRHPPEPADQRRAAERRHRHAGDGEDAEDHEDERDGGSEVGLGDDEEREEPRHEADRLGQLLQRARRLGAGEVRGEPDRDRNLGELGGLEGERAEGEPAARAVHGRRSNGDERAEEAGDDEQRRRDQTQAAVVAARADDERGEAEERVDPLPLERGRRVAPTERGRRRGGAVDHHEPEGDEGEADEHEELELRGARLALHLARARLLWLRVGNGARPVGPRARRSLRAGDRALHASAPTRRRNSSPRASKFANWSKLAQAGERSTTSPGCAAACAAARPRSSVPSRVYGRPAASSAGAMSSAVSPMRWIVRTLGGSSSARAVKSSPLREPPRIRWSGASA